MGASKERKTRLAKVRGLLNAQGEDENLSRAFASGESYFRINQPLPAGLKQALTEAEGAASAAESERLFTVRVDWLSMICSMMGYYVPDLTAEWAGRIRDTDGVTAAELGDWMQATSAEMTRRREPGALRFHGALNHMVVFAPEVLQDAARLLVASGQAWAACENDDDREGAERIIREALKEVERAAFERVALRLKGRPRAFTKKELARALFSLFEQDAPRPYSRGAVVEGLREQGIVVTDRTLSEYAAWTHYGSWEALVEGHVKEFEHLMGLRDEELPDVDFSDVAQPS